MTFQEKAFGKIKTQKTDRKKKILTPHSGTTT